MRCIIALTIEKAQQILDDYYDLTHTKYEDDISLIHALEFLIQETKNPEYMVELGGWYYEQRQFDLAEEYYLMAASLEYVDAYECLGYIYYYGRVGQPDYKKAFHYYKLAVTKEILWLPISLRICIRMVIMFQRIMRNMSKS